MRTSELQPWPNDDTCRAAALRGVIRVGLAEAVRTSAGLYYRLLIPSAEALAALAEVRVEAAARR